MGIKAKKTDEKRYRLFVVTFFRKELGRPERGFRAFTTEELEYDLDNSFHERGIGITTRQVWERLQKARHELMAC